MNKSINNILVVLVMTLVMGTSCDQDAHDPVEESKSVPGGISNVQATPTPGGAVITYTLPADDDLLYIRGIYYLPNGEEVEVKSSFYSNFLVVEGLADTKEHIIELYSVSRSEVSSEPVEVSFIPLEASFYDTFRSVTMQTTFGGMNLQAKNEARDDLAYLLLERDKITNEWVPMASSLYSSAETINYTIRGYHSDSTYVFGLVIRDRFQNYTDTIFSEIQPLFEEEIPTDTYLFRILGGDAPRHASTGNNNALWDGQIAGWPNSVLLTQSPYTPFIPHMITIDMGIEAKLSRVRIWDYPEWGEGGQNVYYARGAMRLFEIYGSTDFNPNGKLDSTWIKMGEFESIKPSGLPEWVVNNDDIEAGQRGIDYDFDGAIPPVRYLRIRCIENWEGGSFIALAEMKIYGNDGNPLND